MLNYGFLFKYLRQSLTVKQMYVQFVINGWHAHFSISTKCKRSKDLK